MQIREVGVTELFGAALLRRELFGDDAVVAVDLDRDADRVDADAGAPELDATITSVVVGLTEAGDANHHPLRSCCDVVLARGDDALDDVVATVEAAPVASRALALLLRGSERRSLDDGLLVESAVYSALQAGPEFSAWRSGRPRMDHDAPPGEPVQLARTNGALDIALNRPHVRNALDTAMREALLEALDLAAADPSVTEIHLRGVGPVFSSGGDLDEFGSFSDPASAHLVRLDRSVARAIANVAARVTAHLHGACAGSGIELPAFARTVLADVSTTITLPELGLGLIPGAGGTCSLPRRIGRHRTAWLALTGRPIDAATALGWGLVDGIEDP